MLCDLICKKGQLLIYMSTCLLLVQIYSTQLVQWHVCVTWLAKGTISVKTFFTWYANKSLLKHLSTKQATNVLTEVVPFCKSGQIYIYYRILKVQSLLINDIVDVSVSTFTHMQANKCNYDRCCVFLT